jgi:2-polyprenyl-3-methyl-5-hydroxy-6-metoxy-1,4-benzoquinol methylase
MSRLLAEQRFHDGQAAARRLTLDRAETLRFADADFLDHETWVRPAFARLGPLAGKTALDYGCGHGMAAVTLARAGAAVTAFDLSPGYVAEARDRAAANGVRVECVAADGEHLPFADGSFEAIWGNAILHHLDLPAAARELWRVLKPGGVAVFAEPWGGNALLEFARRRLPYPGKDRTADERPLTRRDLDPLREVFPRLTWEGHQLAGMARRVVPALNLTAFDARLLRVAPILRNVCRYVVVALPKG